MPQETTDTDKRSACNITPGRGTRDELLWCGGSVCLAKIHVEQLSKDAGILIPELILPIFCMARIVAALGWPKQVREHATHALGDPGYTKVNGGMDNSLCIRQQELGSRDMTEMHTHEFIHIRFEPGTLWLEARAVRACGPGVGRAGTVFHATATRELVITSMITSCEAQPSPGPSKQYSYASSAEKQAEIPRSSSFVSSLCVCVNRQRTQ